MEFLAPIMLLGALGVAVPVAIHLFGRSRAKVVQFAAMEFLLGSQPQLARRYRVRELALLLVRVLICLAVALALSKPYATCTSSGPEVSRGPQAAVIIIDDSFAVAWSDGDDTLLERAKREALAILDQLGPEADVAILRSAEDAPGVTELSRDHLRLRDRIGDIEASARPAATWTALRRAGQLLAASNHEQRTVFLISLLAKSGFQHGDEPPWPADTGPVLVPVGLTDGEVVDNLAVIDLAVERDPASGSRGVRVTVEVGNFGLTPAVDYGIGLRIEDRLVARGQIALRPGERQVKQFLATLPVGSRFADIAVELDPDPLLIDNRRFARTELREEIRVLLVNGDPHTVRHDDELFYIESALRPGDRGDSGAVLTIITVDDLPSRKLAEFDVIVLANVRALRRKLVGELAAWVEAGGGLIVSVGDNVDADAYGQTMLPLLPQRLRDTFDASYGARGSERAERALRLTKWESDHPVFSVFTDDAPGLREARFDKIFLLGPTTRVTERRVLARYTNGAAAMVEARSGAGRLMLFTSTLDRDWNDLVIHPGFLPLVQQSGRYLARKQDQRSRNELLVGRSARVSVNPDDQRLEVRGPGGAGDIIDADRLQGRAAVRVTDTPAPGLYRVWATDESGQVRRRAESDFAVNIDPRGSDLAPLALDELPASGRDEVREPSAVRKRDIELWHAIAAGLIMLLLFESLLLLRR